MTERLHIEDFCSFGATLAMTIVQAGPIDMTSFDDMKVLKGDYRNLKFPLVFKQDSGKKLTDIIRTGFASLFLISQRMKNILEEYSLTGWKVFPVNLLDKKNNEIDGYYGFSVTGKCGPPDYDKCEIVEKQMVPTGPVTKYYKGRYIGLDKWDGTDFFIPEGTAGIVVTKKAAEVLKKAKITNLVLENLMDWDMPEYGILIIRNSKLPSG